MPYCLARTWARPRNPPRKMISPTPTEERDKRLGQLLADLSEQRRRGQVPDVNAVAAQHPDLADELRELWGAVLLADELTRSEHPSLARRAGKGEQEPFLALRAGEEGKSFGDYELLEEIGRGGM